MQRLEHVHDEGMLELGQNLLLTHNVIHLSARGLVRIHTKPRPACQKLRLLHLDDSGFFQRLQGIMSSAALVRHKPAVHEFVLTSFAVPCICQKESMRTARLTRPKAPVPSVFPRLKSLTAWASGVLL